MLGEPLVCFDAHGADATASSTSTFRYASLTTCKMLQAPQHEWILVTIFGEAFVVVGRPLKTGFCDFYKWLIPQPNMIQQK